MLRYFSFLLLSGVLFPMTIADPTLAKFVEGQPSGIITKCPRQLISKGKRFILSHASESLSLKWWARYPLFGVSSKGSAAWQVHLLEQSTHLSLLQVQEAEELAKLESHRPFKGVYPLTFNMLQGATPEELKSSQ